MWNEIRAFFQGASVAKRITIHMAIVIGFLSAVWAASSMFEIRARQFAEGWRQTLAPITCTNDTSKTDLPLPVGLQGTSPVPGGPAAPKGVAETTVLLPVAAATAKPPAGPDPPSDPAQVAQAEERLEGQFHQIQQRIRHHFNQLITYYSYSFATTIMVGILAAVAAITLVFITLSGWQPSSEYKKTIFLLATVTATYSAAFPGIFELQKNIDDNRYLYLKYVALANEMCSYQSTAETPDNGPAELNAFIHLVDTELSNLNKIAAGTEANQIPDFSKALSQAMGQAGAKNFNQRNTQGPKAPPKH